MRQEPFIAARTLYELVRSEQQKPDEMQRKGDVEEAKDLF